MKALLLAAGLGTRLKPITDEVPKCMVPVNGRPVLEHLVYHLGKFGITEIIVNLHYLPEVVYKHFGSKLLYFYEPELLGEVGTIMALRKWLRQDDFIVMNGDTLTNVNLFEMYSFHQRLDKEKATAFFDRGRDVCAGTWIIGTSFYWKPWCQARTMADIPAKRFYGDYYWLDVGTPDGLLEAREQYEKKTDRMP